MCGVRLKRTPSTAGLPGIDRSALRLPKAAAASRLAGCPPARPEESPWITSCQRGGQARRHHRCPARPAPRRSETDGFQLVIDALKLNGIDTIFGLPGIPITDLTRKLQRNRPARHLVPARAERRLRGVDRGVPDAEAGHLPHGVGAGLPQRPHRACARDHQLLPDDPDQRLELGARDRRPAAGRLRGDGPARDRQAAVQGGVPRAACRGHRRRRRARDPRRAVGPSRRRVPRPAREALPAVDGRGSRQELADQGRRSGAEADSRARRRASARSTC